MTLKRIFFFTGSEYSRYDWMLNGVNVDAVDGTSYPRQIAGPWPGLFGSGIQAAFCWRNGKVYFFSGTEYSRYDALLDRVDDGYPKVIADQWGGVRGTGFESGIDAALHWGNGQVYWFKGDQYLRLSNSAAGWAVDAGYPKPIGPNWPGVAAAGFDRDISGCVNWGDGNIYWFKGDQYIRLTDKPGTGKGIDPGFPRQIADAWPGVPTTGIEACVEWPYAEVAPGGFVVPTARTGWTGPTPQGDGTNRVGEFFEMHVDFVDVPAPAACAVGEFRQFVRGAFQRAHPVTGVMSVVTHQLPDPGGGAPRDMLPIPAAGAASDNFREDGHVGGNWIYGHRRNPVANPGPHNQFLPDRETGCQFRGTDFPGYRNVPGTTYSVTLDFRAQAVDMGTAGEVLDTAHWSVTGSGTL